MKLFLLIPIKLYWALIPVSRRRTCLFKESCSRNVYNATVKYGLLAGLKALQYRYKNCRPGYGLFTNRDNGTVEMVLPNSSIIPNDEISPAILQCHHTGA